MVLTKLDKFGEIVGDDSAYHTMKYWKVPTGYRLSNLTFPPESTHPLVNATKDRLIGYAERWYKHWEINGKTIADFHENCQLALEENVDNLEKFLEVYWSDISKPVLGRTVKRTYDTANTDTEDQNMTDHSTGTGSGNASNHTDNTDYDIPYDNGETQGTSKNVTDGTSENTTNTENNRNSTLNKTGVSKKTGTETEEWSDLGVRPNYETLNGFLDYNRSVQKVFVSYFYDCFTIMEEYY